MVNLTQGRRGYRFEMQNGPLGDDPNKRNITVLEIGYLKGASRKGVLTSIRNTTIEQFDAHRMESFEVFGGVSVWAKELARKSDKEVIKVAEALDSVVPLIVTAFQENPEKGKAALFQSIQEKVHGSEFIDMPNGPKVAR